MKNWLEKYKEIKNKKAQNGQDIINASKNIPAIAGTQFDTKKIVNYQPGVISGNESGFYLYSRNPSDGGFNVERDREFIKQNEMLTVQRTPQWIEYMKSKSKAKPVQTLASYQNGSKIPVPKTRSSEIKEHNSREEYNLPMSMRQRKDTPEEIAQARKLRIAKSIEARKIPYTKSNWREQLAAETSAIGDKMRVSDTPNFFDDYVNPAVWIGGMASMLGQAPYQAQQTNSYMPYITSVGTPLAVGAIGGLGTKTTGQFVNNMVNPLAGVKVPTKSGYRLITAGNLTLPSFKNMMNELEDVSKGNNVYKDIALSNRREYDELLRTIDDGEGWKLGPDDLEKSAIRVKEGDADYWNYINAHRAELADKHFKLNNLNDALDLGQKSSYNKRFISNAGEENVYYRGQSPDTWDLEEFAHSPSGDAWSLINQTPNNNTQYLINADDYKHYPKVRTEEDAIKMGQLEAGEVFNEKMVNYKGKYDPILKNQNGGIIDDDMGQWKYPGEITRINSNNITMQGVNYPVLGVSDTGDTKMMYPGEDYKFKGKKVTEYPQIAKNGKELKKLDQLTNFTNYNTPQPGGWLSKYE